MIPYSDPLKNEQNFNILHAGINAGILAGLVSILNDVLEALLRLLEHGSFSRDYDSIILLALTEAFIGLLAAFAWYVYKKEILE